MKHRSPTAHPEAERFSAVVRRHGEKNSVDSRRPDLEKIMKRTRRVRVPADSIVRICFFAAVVLSASIAGVQAQNAKRPAAVHATLPASGTQNQPTAAPQPSPEMQSLARALSGRWHITEKFAPSVESPESGEGYGEEVWRSGPGGFTFMEELHDASVVRGEGFLTGFMWWDSTAKVFRGMLCTSQNPRGCDPKGSDRIVLNWDGKQLVVDIDFEESGKKILWHEVFGDITPTSFTQTADSGEAGTPLKRVLTIHGTKISDTAK
jgi:hypothetical protein